MRTSTPYSYLRFSVTDRCNFNCFYCRPSARRRFLSEKETLTFPEMLLLVREFSGYGIKHVRLTGGEPLLREGITSFIRELASLGTLPCLSLTTNGFHLAQAAGSLKASGIKKVNISLDTLKRERFRELTGADVLHKVKDGVLKSKKAGFESVKLNCVLMKDFNDDEVLDFVDFARTHQVDVRFIEYFPTKSRCDCLSHAFVPSDSVRGIIEERFGALEFLGCDPHCGPAQYFRIAGEVFRIGFISSVTDFFCPDCNRLRLTADGKLYPCLHSAFHADLKKPLRENDGKGLSKMIGDILEDKKSYNRFACSRTFEMSSMGG